MPLSETGLALQERLRTQKMEATRKRQTDEERSALRHPSGDYNAMAPMHRLARVLELDTFGKECQSTAPVSRSPVPGNSPLRPYRTRQFPLPLRAG